MGGDHSIGVVHEEQNKGKHIAQASPSQHRKRSGKVAHNPRYQRQVKQKNVSLGCRMKCERPPGNGRENDRRVCEDHRKDKAKTVFSSL